MEKTHRRECLVRIITITTTTTTTATRAALFKIALWAVFLFGVSPV